MKSALYKAASAAIILSVSCLSNIANAGLIVTQNNNAAGLVTNILGGGISSSNSIISGAANAFGTFTGGLSAGIGIESGIILSTGKVVDAVGPNTATNTSTDFFGAGSAALTTLSGFATQDAALINFDFTTTSGDLFFNYVFASEEYPEFVNTQVNDVFAFFLDGVNIALIPGTTTPVSIDTINGGVNSALFNSNTANTFNIQYDGFTNVFTAQALGLTAGVHTISIAIADAGDGVVDSSVFIQSSSFANKINSVPEPSTLAIFALGIMGLASRKFKKY